MVFSLTPDFLGTLQDEDMAKDLFKRDVCDLDEIAFIVAHELHNIGIQSIGELVMHSESELLRLAQQAECCDIINQKSLAKVKDALARCGLHLGILGSSPTTH